MEPTDGVKPCGGHAAIRGSHFITCLNRGGHRTQDAQSNSIHCIRLRIRPDHSGLDLLPARNR